MHSRLSSFFQFWTLVASLAVCVASANADVTRLGHVRSKRQPANLATLRRDDPRYEVKAVPGGFLANSPGQDFVARFSSKGVSVQKGTSRWNLSVSGYGYGERLEVAKPEPPQVTGNRVEYDRGPLTEWYVNASLGLEQGFTLKEPPGDAHGDSLTIAIALSGDLKASLEGASELTLSSDGYAVMRYSGLAARDADGHVLHAWLELASAHLLLLRVTDSQARYPLIVDPYIQSAKLTASDAAAVAQVGQSLAISRDASTTVAGAPFANAAYVFIKPAGDWTTSTETAKLTPSDQGTLSVLFGASVAVSTDGNVIVIGAPVANDNGNLSSGLVPGAAYVFVRPSGGWVTSTETAKLTASDGQPADFFGQAVAIAGDAGTVVVGAPQNGTAGAAYMFVEPSGGWSTMTENAKLTESNPVAGDEFGGGVFQVTGHGIALPSDGNTVFVGAPHATGKVVPGATLVFGKPVGGWTGTLTETARLTASDGAFQDGFGQTLAVSDDGTVLIGGAGGSMGFTGAAYVFLMPSGGWMTATENAKLTASDGVRNDGFGDSVAVSGDGNMLAVGADVKGTDTGAAYIFSKPSGGWVSTANFTQEFTSGDPHQGDFFGRSLGLSFDGTWLAVGAPANPANLQASVEGPGAAYQFKFIAPTTTSLASSANPSVFGQSVTLTATVTPVSGSGVPSGMVTISEGSNVLGTPMLVGGSAAVMLTFPVGSHSITAVYSGDSAFAGSTSAVLLQVVNKASTNTTLTSSPNPSSFGQAVNLTATISVVPPGSGPPSGTVTFEDGSTVLNPVPVTVTSATASLATSALSVGSHVISASYSGDPNFNGSGGTFNQQVGYAICALYDQTRTVYSGAVFPIKMYLCDVNGGDFSSPATIVHATAVTMVSGFVGAPQSPGNANPDNDFRFDAGQGSTGGYIFNLKTSGLGSGTYSLQFTVSGDPVAHSLTFGVN